MATSTAWLLNLGGALRAALGERQMLHFVDAPQLLEIPETPPHCHQVLIWQDNILPVMDLGAWLGVSAAPDELAFTGIAAYQEHPEQPPQYGALLLAGIPTRVQVNDDQVCELPGQPRGWQYLAMSCFTHDDQAIPILNLPSIFSDALVRV